jgi:hypothetical protein
VNARAYMARISKKATRNKYEDEGKKIRSETSLEGSIKPSMRTAATALLPLLLLLFLLLLPPLSPPPVPPSPYSELVASMDRRKWGGGGGRKSGRVFLVLAKTPLGFLVRLITAFDPLYN